MEITDRQSCLTRSKKVQTRACLLRHHLQLDHKRHRHLDLLFYGAIRLPCVLDRLIKLFHPGIRERKNNIRRNQRQLRGGLSRGAEGGFSKRSGGVENFCDNLSPLWRNRLVCRLFFDSLWV